MLIMRYANIVPTLSMFLFAAATTLVAQNSCTIPDTTNILATVETFAAPPFTESGSSRDREVYDFRVKSQLPIPQTFTDVLIADFWTVMVVALDLRGLSPHRVSEEAVTRAISVYVDRPWTQIPGYRPWTHLHFIHCLTAIQRSILAKDIVSYMSRNGVRDPGK